MEVDAVEVGPVAHRGGGERRCWAGFTAGGVEGLLVGGLGDGRLFLDDGWAVPWIGGLVDGM